MNKNELDFVKGHCGWDSVTLLYGEQVPAGREHHVACTLFDPPCQGGSEIGFMYKAENTDHHARLRIIDSTTRTWLPMCGGMSQVIGLACVATPMQDYFGVKREAPVTRVNILSDAGMVPIDITFKDDRVSMITTHLMDYVDYLYKDGVCQVMVGDIPALKVGYFLIFRMDDLKRAHPDMEFGHRRPGPALDLLGEIQHSYLVSQGLDTSSLYSMIYDLHPAAGGDARIFTRFYKGPGVPQASPMEAQCGTGSAAVAVAMAQRDELPFSVDRGKIVFEWGDASLTDDPYGTRKSAVHLAMSGSKIRTAAFSHNVVELQSAGTLYLPSFEEKLF